VIAHPSGEVFINTQSTPALARAGTGDVLAGMIAAFASQHMNAFEAAQCAVWLHSQRALQIETELSAAHCDALRLAIHSARVD
jgi:NAD(P)H-hydrate epimerase